MRAPHVFRLVVCAAAIAAISGIVHAAGKEKTKTDTAIFAGGCFWCMESPYDYVKGVISTTPGYTGGTTVNPTYRQVSTGTTGHAESMRVEFDPAKVSYETLLQVYWRTIRTLMLIR